MKESIKDTLRNILHFYGRNRQVGNTHVAVHGLKAVGRHGDATLICRNMNEAKLLSESLGLRSMGYKSAHQLLGLRSAVAFDHSALEEIFADSLQRIEELEERVAELEK